MRTYKRGFVALMSVIIVSAILLILLFTLGASSFFSRFDALDTESKRESLALAESCAYTAMLKLAQDSTYQPTPSVGDKICVDGTCPPSSKSCRICKISAGAGSTKIILTRAVYGGAYANLSVTFDPTPTSLAVSGWSELASSSAPTCVLP